MTGLAVVINGGLMVGFNVPNCEVIGIIESYKDIGTVVCAIEDVRAYKGYFKQNLIDTCKYIGELQYCLKVAGIEYVLVPRSSVKWWLYSRYTSILEPLVMKIISQKKLINKNGEFRKPSFVHVNDRIVANAMREIWQLKKPKPGHKVQNGIISHAIQALAVATYLLKNGATLPGMPVLEKDVAESHSLEDVG